MTDEPELLGTCGLDETLGAGHWAWGHPRTNWCREWEPLPPEDQPMTAEQIAWVRSQRDV